MWPMINEVKPAPADAKEWSGKEGKEALLSETPGEGS